MNIGIFGGSFDPIHEGHVNLAKYILDHTDLDEVWLMVSPRNPLKDHGPIATDRQRLEMARLAVKDIPGLQVSDFEFHLPIPSYTYKTLTELKKSYPEHDFRLIIGGDNWADFNRWRNPEEIISDFGVIIYPRPNETLKLSTQNAKRKTQNVTLGSSPMVLDSFKKNIVFLKGAPQMPISSTE
ncbi:MAG: nicotinate (nicotinamide) nucleotide adenylyltransferase, partial [Muribaculaceae bacterium]|nr:nicotinate (nicotinamide) nucleotide adenylyltransferase [Muribaculaceae bacterium]